MPKKMEVREKKLMDSQNKGTRYESDQCTWAAKEMTVEFQKVYWALLLLVDEFNDFDHFFSL